MKILEILLLTLLLVGLLIFSVYSFRQFRKLKRETGNILWGLELYVAFIFVGGIGGSMVFVILTLINQLKHFN